MKIAFLINQTPKELANFTTTLLALEAWQRGHDLVYIGLADFLFQTDGHIAAHVRLVTQAAALTDPASLISVLKETKKTRMPMAEIDVLWLRFDPVLDMISRPWAAAAGLQFAQLIQQEGRLVINNPDALVEATNKLYLEKFPKAIRPKTIVTRHAEDVIQFLDRQGEKIILKPLKGSGGKNVFLLPFDQRQNLKQSVEVIARDGYVLAQEYLPAATKGDIRFFLLDGEPIQIDGKYAAVNRVQQGDEIRSNIHQGAEAQVAEIDQALLDLVKQVSPKIKADGMYFVGLDVVGDKIMEINVFSPGALLHANTLNQVNYTAAIIQHLEKKVSDFYAR